MSSSVLHDQVPHSILFLNQPLFCLSRVFGCVCFVHIFTPRQATKVSFKATPVFNRVIDAILLILPDISSLWMSPSLRTFFTSTELPSLLDSCPFLLSCHFKIHPFHLRQLHLDLQTCSRPLQVNSRHPHVGVEHLIDSPPMETPSSQQSYPFSRIYPSL